MTCKIVLAAVMMLPFGTGAALADEEDCHVPMARWQPRSAVERMAEARVDPATLGIIGLKREEGCKMPEQDDKLQNGKSSAPCGGEIMVRVWDPLIRVFHWGLVTSFAVAWVSAEYWDDLHETAGYVAASLIAVRLVWGLVGPRYARFTQLIKGSKAITGYIRAMIDGSERRYIGHNPAGAAMIVLLILGMLGTAGSGWMMTLPEYSHVRWVKDLHEVMANGMLFLVALHVGGVVLASWRHGENLARAMVTGRKKSAGHNDIA
ncbi:MAG TPA: cytochrome b/b6 domain-containing protein [Paracoccaceae bacterium]|nr:cytochrome b/b6 domain-containing protein [Paracoccaceae bacterium]